MHAAGTAEKETSVNIEHRWHANERADTKQPSTTTRNGTANRKTRHAKAVPVENNTAGGLNHIVNNITAPRDKWPGSLKETSTCPVQRPQLRGERITQEALGGNLKPAQLPVMGEWGGGGTQCIRAHSTDFTYHALSKTPLHHGQSHQTV